MTFTEPVATPLALLLLGRGTDPASERGVDCPGELPAASDPTLVERAAAAKAALGERAFVLGHHYQRDEVIQFADVTGDSFKLAREAAARPDAEYIVFCGVHFMAESADILTTPAQQVVLPDLAAGCSMADMASYQQVVEAWDVLADAGVADVDDPGHLHELLAPPSRRSPASTAARSAPRPTPRARCAGPSSSTGGDGKVLFLPDQHLGRNTAVLQLGIPLERVRRVQPAPARRRPRPPSNCAARTGDPVAGALLGARPVHRGQHRRRAARGSPASTVLVHPECRHEVVGAADHVGSTEYIIKTIDAAPAGSSWAVGTELNLVRRLAASAPGQAGRRSWRRTSATARR